MIRLKDTRMKRTFTAAGLLLLFTLTSLFATYQSGINSNVAHAQNEDKDRTCECIVVKKSLQRTFGIHSSHLWCGYFHSSNEGPLCCSDCKSSSTQEERH